MSDTHPRLVRACVFDAYGTLFDFGTAVARCRDAIGPRADELSAIWRVRQVEYTWLRALMRRHADFRQVTAEALDYAMEAVGLADDGVRTALLAAYETLDAYPDAAETLRALRARGMPCAILSNGPPDMLRNAADAAGLTDHLDHILSVESVGVFKPDPRVYQLACETLRLPPDAIAFQSANGWDAAGAAAFGMRVHWVNRGAAPTERLPGRPTAEIRSLGALPATLFPPG